MISSMIVSTELNKIDEDKGFWIIKNLSYDKSE